MANYYTHASFIFAQNLTPAELYWAKKELEFNPEELPKEELLKWAEDRGIEDVSNWPGFNYKLDIPESHIWIYHDESIDIENAATFIQNFLAEHRPEETVILEWAAGCDKARLNAFGGGVVIITAEHMHYMNTSRYADEYPKIRAALKNAEDKLGKEALKELRDLLGD